MSAMKMDFICKESPEKGGEVTVTASPSETTVKDTNTTTPTTTATAKGANLSTLLNTNKNFDVEMDEKSEGENRQPASSIATTQTNNPRKRSAPTGGETPAQQTDGDGSERNALSDNENSEDEQAEHATWEDVDLNPAVDMVNRIIRESLEAGKTYNKSITAKTTQLITGCDNVLLELKNLSDAREVSRKKASSNQGGQDCDCACGVAMVMLPVVTKMDLSANATAALAAVGDGKMRTAKAPPVDEIAEDQTDRVLFKIEASMERLRELAEMIQATSMQGEANLVAKVNVQEGAIKALGAAVQASAAAATAAAIAQERGRSSSAFGKLYSPMQIKRLQEWYYLYPRPLMDELTLMRTILNYRPYANPFQVGGLTIAHVRDWFKRRRYRERMRYVKLALEAGRDPAGAEEEIDLRIEQRIEHLRATVDPNELVKEVDKVRAESSMYDSMVGSFTRSGNLDSYISASHVVPTFADQQFSALGRVKRQRTQESDLDDAMVVKVGNRVEVLALQNRIRSLLALPRTAINTNSLQQVIDIMRSMDVSPDVRIQTGIVADLKKILKIYKKPTLLRKSTIALLESLGMNRRAVLEDDIEDEQPVKTEAPPAPDATSSSSPLPSSAPASSATASPPPPPNDTPPAPKQRGKKEKGKVLRPMKFSMRQVMALEGWFQQKYKPSQAEMEGYLDQLNAPPLRDEKQPVDVNMTQLRRWFNKRRCLRRPPFALMTQQEATKEEAKNPENLKPITSQTENGGDGEVEENDSSDDSNDDSSDDDDDDTSDDE